MGNPAPELNWTLCQRDEKCVTLWSKVKPTHPATNVSFTSQLPLSAFLHLLPGSHLNVTCLASNTLGRSSATSPLTVVDYLPPVPVLVTWCLCFACSDCQDSTQIEENITLTAFSSQKLKAQCSAGGSQDQGWSFTGVLDERTRTMRSWSTARSHTHLILIDALSTGHAGILHCHGLTLKLDVIGKEGILSKMVLLSIHPDD